MTDRDPEIELMRQAHAMLVCVPKESRRRIINWLLDRLEKDWWDRDLTQKPDERE